MKDDILAFDIVKHKCCMKTIYIILLFSYQLYCIKHCEDSKVIQQILSDSGSLCMHIVWLLAHAAHTTCNLTEATGPTVVYI